MVRVGDAWKLTRVPLPLEGDNAQIPGEGILMQPELPGMDSLPGGAGMTAEVRKLLEELSALDEQAPDPVKSSAKELGAYHVARARMLGELANVAATDDERKEWKRQQVDGIAAATQTGVYPNGLEVLQRLKPRRRSRRTPISCSVHCLPPSSRRVQHQAAQRRHSEESRGDSGMVAGAAGGVCEDVLRLGRLSRCGVATGDWSGVQREIERSPTVVRGDREKLPHRSGGEEGAGGSPATQPGG